MVTKVTKKVIKKIPAIHVHDVHFKIKFCLSVLVVSRVVIHKNIQAQCTELDKASVDVPN